MARSVLVVLALVVASGCLGATPPPAHVASEVLPYLPDVFPTEVDHDHTDAALHAERHNLELESVHACTPDGAMAGTPGGFTDIAFANHYAFVGNAHGFCVLDLTNPAAPRFVSQYAGEHASDLEVSADGDYVFLATQRNRVTDLTNDPTSPTQDLPRGVSVVNVKDPAHPAFESYYPVPTNGVHTLTPYLYGDRQIVFVQTYDWVPPAELQPGGVPPPPVPTQNAPLTQRIEVTELKDVGGKMTLERIALWSLARPADNELVNWFPHDAFAQKHPITGKVYLYVAYWDAGLVTLDVTDPANPTLVSRYDDKAPSIYNQYHDVKAFPELIEGRHITVAGPEIPSGRESGVVRIFDTTDPAKPVQLGTWRLPGNPGIPGGFLYSPHVFTLHDGRIYIGHYHAGVWVIDVHTLALAAHPATLGFAFPRGDEMRKTWSPQATTWGAYWHDGYVYATEESTGVHVLRFAGDTP